MGTLSCPICNAAGMDVDQLKIHFGTEHPNPSPFRCLKCQLRFGTVELLKIHQTDLGHSDESDAIGMVQMRTSLFTLISAASDCRYSVERFQANMGNSDGADILAACVNNILTACETAGIVGLKEVLKPIELFPVEPTENLPTGQADLEERNLAEMENLDETRETPLLTALANLNSINSDSAETIRQLGVALKTLGELSSSKQPQVITQTQSDPDVDVEIVSNPRSDPNEIQIHRGTEANPVGLNLPIDRANVQMNQNETELDTTEETPEEMSSGTQADKTMLNSKDSRKKAEKPPRMNETGKTPVVVGSDKHSTIPAANKTTRKRVASTTDPADLTIVSDEAKRRKTDSSLTATVQDNIATVRQANLPISTTPMQENLAEKQLESSKSVVEAEFGSEALSFESQFANISSSAERKTQLSKTPDIDVDLEISTLSDLFDTTSPSELLPKVIEQMKNQMEDVQVQLSAQRLIDRYSCQQLEEVESSLRRSLIGVLLKGVQLHRYDSFVIETFCSLLARICAHQDEIDWSLKPIGFLLEIVCDDENVSTTARKSALKEVWNIAANSDYDLVTKSVGQEPSVEEICQSIRYQLDKGVYDESLEISWELLNFICQENEQRFVNAGVIRLFQQCYKKFPYQTTLVSEMTSLMYFERENKWFHQELMTDGNLAALWEIWQADKERRLNYECCQIFLSLIDSPANWPLGHPTIDEVKMKLKEEEEVWMTYE